VGIVALPGKRGIGGGQRTFIRLFPPIADFCTIAEGNFGFLAVCIMDAEATDLHPIFDMHAGGMKEVQLAARLLDFDSGNVRWEVTRQGRKRGLNEAAHIKRNMTKLLQAAREFAQVVAVVGELSP